MQYATALADCKSLKEALSEWARKDHEQVSALRQIGFPASALSKCVASPTQHHVSFIVVPPIRQLTSEVLQRQVDMPTGALIVPVVRNYEGRATP